MTHNERMKYLVDKLNEYRHLYYNCNDPVVSDEVYDRMYDELKARPLYIVAEELNID